MKKRILLFTVLLSCFFCFSQGIEKNELHSDKTNLNIRNQFEKKSDKKLFKNTAENPVVNLTPPTCGGSFFDSGGSGGTYFDGENITTTICPSVAGELVTVSFLSFSTESGFDTLTIYDGNNIGSDLIGNYSGNSNPGVITASSASGCLTFVFHSDGSVVGPGWQANVTCSPAPICPKPVGLSIFDSSYNTVSLNWTDIGPATSWQVLALPCGSPVPVSGTTGWVSASSNPFVLTGLASNTCYTIYVRGNCGSDGLSFWSNPVTITTPLAPPICGGNFIDSGNLNNYTNNSNISTLISPTNLGDKVTVTFTSFNTEAVNDVLRIYNGNSAAAPLIGMFSGNTLPPSITSSAVDGSLFFVFTSNSSITRQGWFSVITCAPAATCPRPLILTSTAITSTSTSLNWIEAGSSTSWEVLTLSCGSPAPTASAIGQISNINTFMVNGLTPNCCNEYYVRSICSATDKSEWTKVYQNVTGNFIVWGSVSGGSSLTGTFPGGTVTATLTGTGNNVTFQSPGSSSNLPATNSSSFSTFGPTSNPPSKSITFTFSIPVIISNYSMADLDVGSSWNDSFNFGGVAFTSTTSSNVIATPTGAIVTSDVGNDAEFASWYMSTTPVTSFSVDFLTTGGLTHAYLGYAMSVFVPCTVDTTPNPQVSVSTVPVCQGDLATVTAVPNLPGSYEYTWTVPAGVAQPSLSTTTLTTLVPGTYSVFITDTVSGLVSLVSSVEVVFTTPVVPTFVFPASICFQTAAPLLPAVSVNGIQGVWSPSVISNTTSGTYLFIPDAGECATNYSFTMVITSPNIVPDFPTNLSFCYGETISNLSNTSPNGITGTWNTNVVNNTNSGTYVFTPSIGQCAVNANLDVTIFEDFDFEFVVGCENEDFVIRVIPVSSSYDVNDVSYNWENDNNVTINTENALNVSSYLDSTLQFEQVPITFNLTITDANGCSLNKSITIENIYCGIQKGISPNSDGSNEFFDLQLLNVERLSIFNRYGLKVYSKSDYKKEWSGQDDSGNLLPDATYYYYIDFKGTRETKTGWIYINR